MQNGTQSVFFMRRFAWQAFHCDAYRQMTFCHPLLERRHFPRCFKANHLSGTQSQYINIVSTTAQQALSKLSSAETNNTTSKQSYRVTVYSIYMLDVLFHFYASSLSWFQPDREPSTSKFVEVRFIVCLAISSWEEALVLRSHLPTPWRRDSSNLGGQRHPRTSKDNVWHWGLYCFSHFFPC